LHMLSHSAQVRVQTPSACTHVPLTLCSASHHWHLNWEVTSSRKPLGPHQIQIRCPSGPTVVLPSLDGTAYPFL
jgi:hypothetical protein